jgi:hypothetical protein
VDTERAIEAHIEPKLLGAFGRQVTNALLTGATLRYVIAEGAEENRFAVLVHTLCSDERVISVWGAKGAAEQEEAWKALIASESQIQEHGA